MKILGKPDLLNLKSPIPPEPIERIHLNFDVRHIVKRLIISADFVFKIVQQIHFCATFIFQNFSFVKIV